MLSDRKIIAIGDVQGCLESLDALLERLPQDIPLLFLGDIVNRGPDSLGVLRRVMALGERAQTLLGNHDLHLLAVAAGVREPHPKDTITPILEAPDSEALLDWVRSRPLLIDTEDALFVHAGIHPLWDEPCAKAQAKAVEERLQSPQWRDELKTMYGNSNWSPELDGSLRVQAVLNALTRLRYVDKKTGKPDYHYKDNPQVTPTHLVPWFEYAQRTPIQKPIVFGHWSTLGLVNRPNVLALDTGCLWGGALTAAILPKREIISIPCPCWSNPLAFKK